MLTQNAPPAEALCPIPLQDMWHALLQRQHRGREGTQRIPQELCAWFQISGELYLVSMNEH